ncbi:MAG: hybrid sensor histidine kinase/response regulator [Gammaproteobacteria bacterium HGW-Gammaproteobacteria-8]|nr:MAG: hybrid sensor histidine kinase/response regulator [Gammaproteobacteria bacterium HGW-Gammaproteobacteria-8]
MSLPVINLSVATLALAGLVWLGLLFAMAVWGERSPARWRPLWPVVYSLSLAVYCTAWTFYGTTSQAARFGWPVPPTFVGTIAFFLFGWPFLRKLVALSKASHATSIADFIASRFGKSQTLAAAVTLVAVLGIVPYISLQLKAVAMSFGTLTLGRVEEAELAAWQDLAFYVAVFMAVFAILFGTRRASVAEHNRGLVLAMGFESLFKLSAMLALGGFVLFGLFGGAGDFGQRTQAPAFSGTGSFLTLTLLGALAMFTLPHQFHIGVVECRDENHLKTARWLFPLFLILISLPILALSRAGAALFAGQDVPADLYVLMLPLADGRSGLATFAFLGGLSAATGMVILASLTLSIMIGNHWLTPALLGLSRSRVRDLGISVRQQRRLGIVLVLLLAYAYSRAVGTAEALADIGALSFSGLAQLAPAVVLAVYRPGLPARSVLAGIGIGVAVWAYVLFVPVASAGLGLHPDWLAHGPLGVAWLSPTGLFGLSGIEALPRAVVSSLVVNLLMMALLLRRDPRIDGAADPGGGLDLPVLEDLARRFLPAERVAPLFAARAESGADDAGTQMESLLEHELSAVVGSASARLLLDAARRRTAAPLEQVADLVGQASERARFSQEVLSGALENMSQGVCVVDSELCLVAWNREYLELFNYPEALIRVGRPIAELMRHNAGRGLLGDGNPEPAIERRLTHMRRGTAHRAERAWPDGRIIEIRGNPLPGGGFVATFTDVTAFRSAERELKRINETLEQRVAERTGQLEQAKIAAEQASDAKTRFLAAVSHDLVQPLNAAQLMAHSLAGQVVSEDQRAALHKISGALNATEDLLEALLDISRLEAGGLRPRFSRFPLGELFEQLRGEFSLMAGARGLRLDCVATGVWVRSDPQMLRRILQNFLSNAVRYTRSGRVLMGVRRRADAVTIGVWDTGPGIPADSLQTIFEEFRRLDPDGSAPGLGLGLAIADRMARLLDHPIECRSEPGRGTFFGLRVPRVAGTDESPMAGDAERALPEGRVLVIDNDAAMRHSLKTLLGQWGFEVEDADDDERVVRDWSLPGPDLLMLDFHLDHGRTGIDVLARLRKIGCQAPAILISADHGAAVREAAHLADCQLLHKPLRPLALRSVISRLMAQRLGTVRDPDPPPASLQ